VRRSVRVTVKIRARYPLIAICLVGGIALALSHSKNSAAHRVSMLRGGTPVTFIFQGDKVRIEEHGSPRVIIFDGESMEYFEVDTEKKTWAVATLRDAVTQGKAHGVQDIKAIDKALLPELRYHAIAERQERLALWIHLLKNTYFYPTTIHSTVAGQPCDGYTEHVDGKVVAEGCYIPWGRKTIRKEDLSAVEHLAEFLNVALAEEESAGGIDLREGPLGRLARSPGFPARRYDIARDGMSGVQLRMVQFVRTLPVEPETFQPPASYTKLDRPAAVWPVIQRVREQAPVQP